MTELSTTLSREQIARVRKETPGLEGHLHLDNAGASLMPQLVVDRMKSAFEKDVLLGGYVAQEQQSDELDAIYNSLATLFGGFSSDYAVVGSAVDGWTKAFYSLPLKPGDNIVTAYTEYCANYVAYLQLRATRGIEIKVARMAQGGGVDLNHLESLVDKSTKLIGLTHMPSSSGEILNAQAVGEIAKHKNVLYQLDACQSAGHIPLNVAELGCDIMTGTARKFLRGPRGVGFLYVNENARRQMEPVVLTNQSAAWVTDDSYELLDNTRVFEAWERSVVNQIGFKAALDYYAALGPEAASDTLLTIADTIRRGLADISHVVPTCPEGARSAIITFNIKGLDALEVKQRLMDQGVTVQTASVQHTRLDLGARDIETAVRVSPHYFISEHDVAQFLTCVDSLKP